MIGSIMQDRRFRPAVNPVRALWQDMFGDLDVFARLPNEFHGMLNPFSCEKAFRVDVEETESNYIVKADLPGVAKEHVDVSLQDNILTIKCNTQEEQESKKGSFRFRERTANYAAREIELPSVDEASLDAKLENGVLTVTAKKSSDARSKRNVPIR